MVALLMWGGWSPAEEHTHRHHLRLVARRVHRRDGRGDRRPARRRAGRPLQDRRRAATALRSRRTRGRNDLCACSTSRASPGSPSASRSRSCSSSRKAKPATGASRAASFEQLYRGEQAAFAGTVANYRAAADRRAPPTGPMPQRVAAAQADINERTDPMNSKHALLLLALLLSACAPGAEAAADPGDRGAAPAARPIRCRRQPRSSRRRRPIFSRRRLTATEQAIQLDELIKWVRRRRRLTTTAVAVASSPERGRH